MCWWNYKHMVWRCNSGVDPCQVQNTASEYIYSYSVCLSVALSTSQRHQRCHLPGEQRSSDSVYLLYPCISSFRRYEVKSSSHSPHTDSTWTINCYHCIIVTFSTVRSHYILLVTFIIIIFLFTYEKHCYLFLCSTPSPLIVASWQWLSNSSD